MPPTLILVYCAFIFLASMLGGSLPSYLKLTHTRLQLAMSLIGGLMLGVALLHLVPHSAVATESLDATTMAATAGLLTMFFLIRIFHVHPHSPHDETPVPCHHAVPATATLPPLVAPTGEVSAKSGELDSATSPFSGVDGARHLDQNHDHDHDHGHGHGHGHPHAHHEHGELAASLPNPVRASLPLEEQTRSVEAFVESGGGSRAGGTSANRGSGGKHFSWFGLAIGLSIHTMIDGMALAASVAVDASHGAAGIWGLPAFLAIALHKPLDAMSIATVMSAGGWTRRSTRWVTVIFSLMCPLGALAFLLGIEKLFDENHTVLGLALGFSAGVFLCIALADLLPEVQFHSHDRIKLSAALLAGVLLAYLITFIEPEHAHDFGEGHQLGSQESHGHAQDHGQDHPHDHPHDPQDPHDH